MEVPDGPAVGGEVALEAPLAPQELHHQRLTAAAGLAVGAVVCAHDGLHLRVLHQGLEGGEVGFLHVLGGSHGVELMPEALRAGMHGEVLGAGGGLHGFPVALQAPDVGLAQLRGEEGILAVGLVAAAPAGIAEDVDVGRPEGQPLVDVPVAVAGGGVVLGAALGGGHIAQLLHQGGVEGSGHADGLGPHGSRAGAGHAVERLVPPVVGRNAQPVNGRRVVAQLAGSLLHRHLADQRHCLLPCLFAVHNRSSL